ncbi:hypothetical protein Enr17x_42070 [Gimesia fumaroli]|uniref:Uncharacterized protein n=1 Tax=Gimesia fumaroli TaxID=2527976 RepID=A0A518IGF1_9PLAN|nr:hypothetical protein Enr17x_42070 [Gimesia fumaroli]
MFNWFSRKKKLAECLETRTDIDDPSAGFDIMTMSQVSNVERIELPEGPVVLIWPKELHSHSLSQIYRWFSSLLNHQESIRHHNLNPNVSHPGNWHRYGMEPQQQEGRD